MPASAPDNVLPLYHAYPSLQDCLPRQPLLNGRTPVHPLTRLGTDNIWIKRDDCTSHLYGGTKVRKMEFLLGEARALRKSRLVAIGAAGSHHLLTTAVFAKRLGLALEAFICDQPMSDAARGNLLALADQSAQLVYGGGQLQAAARFFSCSLLKHTDEYFVFPGGSSALGTVGVVNAVFELKTQIDEGLMPRPALLVCALGSGGTLAGLALGAQLAGLQTDVVGVRAYPERIGPVPTLTIGRVCRLIKRTYRLLKSLGAKVPVLQIQAPRILGRYLGRGYALPTRSGESAQRLLASSEGIQLDSTYTAKTFAAVLDLRRCLADPAPVLYWHTYGGEFAGCNAPLNEYRKLPRAFHFMFGSRLSRDRTASPV